MLFSPFVQRFLRPNASYLELAVRVYLLDAA